MRKKTICVAVLLVVLALGFSRCFDNGKTATADARGKGYAGSAACISCHRHVADLHKLSAHGQTSSPVTSESMQAWKQDQIDSFVFNDQSVVKFQSRPNGFYQASYKDGQQKREQKMDVSIGSGEKAQTYGSWMGTSLLELPLTRFQSVHGWANSPGFPLAQPYFDRVIQTRCFECHSSFISRELVAAPGPSIVEKLDRNSIIYGIDCERCHGPALEHVQYQQANPSEKTAKFITSWKQMPRARQLDACAVCHSGNDIEPDRSTFGFAPGDTLANFFMPFFGGGSQKEPDVHAKQMQLLERSRCYINSSSMECTTCHDPHSNERNQLAIFSSRCITCHEPGTAHFCPKAKTLGMRITQNCIDCHMPKQASKKIGVEQGTTTPQKDYLLRTHLIAIYPEQKSIPQ